MMLQPISCCHLHFESILLRSYIYRFKLRDFTAISSRSFHRKRLPTDKDDVISPVESEYSPQSTSLTLSWKRFHFPPSNTLFKADNVDPDEWMLVYRLKWSIKAIYSIVFFHVGAIVGFLVMFYRIFIEKKKFTSKRFVDQTSYRYSLIGATSLGILYSLILIKLFPKLILRGYYSPKYQRFMFIRGTVLTPWKVRKLIVAPGNLEPRKESFYLLQANFQVKNIQTYLFESNFFYPAYFNVLLGYSNPKILSKITYNPDEIFTDKYSN